MLHRDFYASDGDINQTAVFHLLSEAVDHNFDLRLQDDDDLHALLHCMILLVRRISLTVQFQPDLFAWRGEDNEAAPIIFGEADILTINRNQYIADGDAILVPAQNGEAQRLASEFGQKPLDSFTSCEPGTDTSQGKAKTR